MVNLIKIFIIYLMFGLVFNSVVNADDSFFDDEVVFEDSNQELDEWSDDRVMSLLMIWLGLILAFRKNGDLILLVAIAPQKKELN
jgi:hypothetical protein